jgi:hypothetical protein
MRPLGKLQLERLMGLASPSCLLVVGDALSKSLVKRGLLKPHFPDKPSAWHRITPEGMRTLADAFEAGQLDQFMTTFPPKREGLAITSPESERQQAHSLDLGEDGMAQHREKVRR